MNGEARDRRGEQGLTLIEILVSVAILAVAIVVALLVYDASRKSFKRGENAAEQQQAVRIAFDRLTADLRMAGYNTNPDGDLGRTDEQIEAAFDGAVVIRADFDGEDPSLATVPETALATGGALTTVSTGNDEIVVYALGKPNWTGGQTLTFSADVRQSPRDNVVETVSIPNLALTQSAAEAPYTLYRITLNNDTGTWGSPSFITRTPLVENVRSLSFTYFDGNRAPVLASAMGGAETAAARAARASVRRVNASLIGLTREPDLEWRDVTDTNPSTQRYRKFELTGDVAPRNLGLKGIRDLTTDMTPPSKPGTPNLYPGHCGGLYISWPANPSADGVSGYKVRYGTSSGVTQDTRTAGGTHMYLAGLTTGTTYYVRIVAYDAAGNESVPSDERNAAVANTTMPRAPTNVVASEDGVGSVAVTWTATTENTSNVTGDPQSPLIRDLAGYRVFRSLTSNISGATLLADETRVKPDPFPNTADDRAANCVDYYYWVRAVDTCGVTSDPTPSASGEHGQAISSSPPSSPTDVAASPMGLDQVRVEWTAVTTDTATPQSNTIFIDRYRVERTERCHDVDVACQSNFTQSWLVPGGATSLLDTTAVSINPEYTYWYRLVALDCLESVPSTPVPARCAFQGRATFINPRPGPVSGVVPIKVQVLDAAQPASGITYGSATFTVTNTGTGQVVATLGPIAATTEVVDGLQTPTYQVEWIADPPGFSYRISVSIPDSAGCSQSTSVTVDSLSNVGCCLDTNPGQGQPPKTMLSCSGTGAQGSDCTTMTYQIYNQRCLTAVRFDSMRVDWSRSLGLKNPADLARVFIDANNFWSPNSPPPAVSPSFATSIPPLSIPYSKTIKTYTMTYDFTNGMRKGTAANEPVNTTVYFTLLGFDGTPTQVTGQCGPELDFSIMIP